MSEQISLEICVDSMESANAAVAGGADRLEVCAALPLGGITPSVGFVSALNFKYPNIPLYCMLRQRSGNFVYSQDEMNVHLEDIEWFKKAGAAGFVFGALTVNGAIDRTACQSIIETARPLPVTFHRAIDVANDWKNCLEEAIDLGFRSVLTSGQEPSALDGVHVIQKMQEEYSDRIDILVGCGVNSSNVANLVEWTKCRWYHASASVAVTSPSRGHGHGQKTPKVTMGQSDNQPLRVTSAKEVCQIKATLAPEKQKIDR